MSENNMNVLLRGLSTCVNVPSFMDAYEPLYRALVAVSDDPVAYESRMLDIADRLCACCIELGLVPDDARFIDATLTQYVESNPALPLLIPMWGNHQLGAVYKAGNAWEFCPSDRDEDEGIIIAGSIESLRNIIGTYFWCRNPKKCIEFIPYGGFAVLYSDPNEDEDECVCTSNTYETADCNALSRTRFMSRYEEAAGCSYYVGTLLSL